MSHVMTTLFVLVELTEGFVVVVTERIVARWVTHGTHLAPAAAAYVDAIRTQRVLVTFGPVTCGAQVEVTDGTVGRDAVCTRLLVALGTPTVALGVVVAAVAGVARVALLGTVGAQGVAALLTPQGALLLATAGGLAALEAAGDAIGAAGLFALPAVVHTGVAHIKTTLADDQVIDAALDTTGVALANTRLALEAMTLWIDLAPPLEVARATEDVVAAVASAAIVLVLCVAEDQVAQCCCVDVSVVKITA